jgi:hypothetical protein
MEKDKTKEGQSRETGNTGYTRWRKTKQKRDNPEKLVTQGTQDGERQNKNTTRYVLQSVNYSLKYIDESHMVVTCL